MHYEKTLDELHRYRPAEIFFVIRTVTVREMWERPHPLIPSVTKLDSIVGISATVIEGQTILEITNCTECIKYRESMKSRVDSFSAD